MNILLLSDKVPWPSRSGGSVATADMIKLAGLSGNQISLISSNSKKHYSREEKSGRTEKYLQDFTAVDTDTSIRVINLVTNLIFSKKPYNFSRFESGALDRALVKQLSENVYDIVQFEGIAFYNYLDLIKRYSKAKIVVRTHNIENQIWRQLADETNSFYRKVYLRNLSYRIEKTERKFISDVDGIIAISRPDLDWFTKNCSVKKGIVIYPDLRLKNEPELTGIDAPTRLCFLGSLDWLPNQSGLKWFIEKVIPIISVLDPDNSFTVAGINPSKKLLELFRSHNVNYRGVPMDSGLFRKDHSIEVVPLFSGSGIRVKILEALSVGLAIVSTTKGTEGLPDDIKSQLMVHDNPEDMARAINQLKSNPEKLARYRRKITSSFYNYFGNLEQSKELSDFYSSIVNGN